MMSWEGMNRRKFPRANYPCLLIIRRDHVAPEAILTHTENIGVGGVGVIVKRELRLFAPLELEVDLLDMQSHVKCNGKVVWSVKRKESVEVKPSFYDVGIEFIDLSEKDRKRVEFIVSRLLTLESPKPE